MARHFYIQLVEWSPLFGALFFFPIPSGPFGTQAFLNHFIRFAAVFVFWQITTWALGTHLLKQGKNRTHSSRELSWLVFFIVAAICTLVALHLFRINFSLETFYLCIASLTLFGLRRFYEERSALLRGILTSFGAYATQGYIGFIIMSHGWQWQPLLPCLSFASLAVSVRYGSFLLTHTDKKYVTVSRIVSALLFLAPVSLTGLVYFEYLSRHYLIPMITVPFSKEIVDALEGRTNLPRAQDRLATIGVLFLALLLISRLVVIK